MWIRSFQLFVKKLELINQDGTYKIKNQNLL